jgi:hypothetical protein
MSDSESRNFRARDNNKINTGVVSGGAAANSGQLPLSINTPNKRERHHQSTITTKIFLIVSSTILIIINNVSFATFVE